MIYKIIMKNTLFNISATKRDNFYGNIIDHIANKTSKHNKYKSISLTFAMGTHPRLGAGSFASQIKEVNIIKQILDIAKPENIDYSCIPENHHTAIEKRIIEIEKSHSAGRNI
jgi:hypothetical protein